MWLPKDHRQLLAGYAHNADIHSDYFDSPTIGKVLLFETERLHPLLDEPLQKVWQYGENGAPPIPQGEFTVENQERFNKRKKRIHRANHFLRKRGLIKWKPHDGAPVILFRITLEGYDLGKKYATRWGSVDAWYQAHKGGILGVLFSLVGGVVGGFLSHWVIAHFFPPAQGG